MLLYILRKTKVVIGVVSGRAGRPFALPIIPPERDIAALETIELFTDGTLLRA